MTTNAREDAGKKKTLYTVGRMSIWENTFKISTKVSVKLTFHILYMCVYVYTQSCSTIYIPYPSLHIYVCIFSHKNE
jgi:hypothetical protein